MKNVLFLAVALAAVSSYAGVRDAVSVCNHTDASVRIAFGYRAAGGHSLLSIGWATIDAGSCSSAIAPALTQSSDYETLYFRAESSKGDLSWSGTMQFCVNQKQYFRYASTLATPFPCDGADHAVAGFKRWVTDKQNTLLVLTSRNAGSQPELKEDAREIQFCNRTDREARVQLGFASAQSGSWISEGAWTVKRASCESVRRSFAGETVLLSATAWSENVFYRWYGKKILCSNDDLLGSADQPACQDSHKIVPFVEVPVKAGVASKTLTPKNARIARNMLRICNRFTDYGNDAYANAALVTADPARPGRFFSHGWYSLTPGKCETIYGVETREVYVSFRKGMEILGPSFLAISLSGKRDFCIADWASFSITEPAFSACNGSRQSWAPFQRWLVGPGANVLNVP